MIKKVTFSVPVGECSEMIKDLREISDPWLTEHAYDPMRDVLHLKQTTIKSKDSVNLTYELDKNAQQFNDI